ncbi:Ribosomal protein L11 methyltransferase (PrmA) Methyltransferase domain [Trypanosoma vivax]|uniref:Methyltransferase domain-containing protein n=1 Tax=Trypanosoma vivax (strain Y486) TaxID=1055687 RepID=G0U7R9_TRYVY|nr:hypothetical protein TRVL_00804 [Trypanosoma vivax]KAH8620454.1 Ribosomal protein L11 methyltransferase (PrmA) Methyltransferase domain [Trypanosoma vivax]CCC51927.1 conserved hypothetical protein [Trypanosoma vivax Y486]
MRRLLWWSLYPSTLIAFTLQHASRNMVSFQKVRGLKLVSTCDSNVSEAQEEVDSDEEEKETLENDGDSGSVTEISETMLLGLPRTQQRRELHTSCLSEGERDTLSRMIYEAHYSGMGSEKEDRAMLYQSALEVRWLEDWAFEKVGQEKSAEARRMVKKAVIERVDLHKPLAYIIGQQPFYSCNIRCVPPLLCPRPETEMWTHWLVRTHLWRASLANAPIKVLDMCCGSGCVGIAIAKHIPLAEVIGVDILEEAVCVSEENARINGLDSRRYRAVKSDMFEVFTNPHCGDGAGGRGKRRLSDSHAMSFDLLVSNPPYVLPEQYVDLPPGVKMWESKLALVGDEKRATQQHLYFQELCELGAAILKPKSKRAEALRGAPNIIIEVGLQAELVASLMERSKLWEDVEVHLDYAQQPRWISAISIH